jgi:hypothetical protein
MVLRDLVSTNGGEPRLLPDGMVLRAIASNGQASSAQPADSEGETTPDEEGEALTDDIMLRTSLGKVLLFPKDTPTDTLPNFVTSALSQFPDEEFSFDDLWGLLKRLDATMSRTLVSLKTGCHGMAAKGLVLKRSKNKVQYFRATPDVRVAATA